MKIRMVTLAAGPGGVWPPGMVLVLDDDVALELVAGGYAVPVVDRGREVAVVNPPEVRSDGAEIKADGKPERRAGQSSRGKKPSAG